MAKRKLTETNGFLNFSPKRIKFEHDKARKAVLNKPACPFVSNPTGDDRVREAYLYESLGCEVSQEREKAAVIVISSLENVPEDVLIRHLESRLFRGLASGRNAARPGFSLVITELLRQLFGEQNKASKYPGLSFDRVLDYLLARTTPTGQIPGQEERDHYLGQLFGLQCFLESGILLVDKPKWMRVLGLLLKLAKKKVWMKSQCGYVIARALREMDESLANTTLGKLLEMGMERTPEGVAIWIVAYEKYPDSAWKNPLATKNIATLGHILLEKKSAQNEETRSITQANRTTQLHFVWDMIADYYIRLAQMSDKQGQQFKTFWSKVVDGMSASSLSVQLKNLTDDN